MVVIARASCAFFLDLPKYYNSARNASLPWPSGSIEASLTSSQNVPASDGQMYATHTRYP